jgi:iron complex transport system substrate-binding protein
VLVGAAFQDAGPRRIVSLIPATTEMLFDMGAGDRLIGVSNYDDFPPEVGRIARVGGLLDPNVERIMSLKPDLVLVYETQADLRRQLDRAQIPIFLYAHKGLPDITETLRRLGTTIGIAGAAEQAAARIERQLADVRSRVAGRPRPKTLLVFGHDPGALRQVVASGGLGFLHDVLELAGGSDALASFQKQSVEMTTEAILTLAPDVIIDLRYGAPISAAQTAAIRRVWNAVPSVPAVRNNRVYVLVGDEFVVPGPRIVVAAQRFADLLHPTTR